MNRKAAVAELDAALAEWKRAFERVPDAALGYLKPGDDYALGGLQIHVNWVLAHYRRVLDGIVRNGFTRLEPQDPAGAEEQAVAAARVGLGSGTRKPAVDEMGKLHQAVRSTAERLEKTDWSRKAPVVYGAGQEPYPTSPEDVVGWLTDHYREHVGQCADLIREWETAG